VLQQSLGVQCEVRIRKQAMNRQKAIIYAEHYFDRGGLREDLARRVAIPTESQNPARATLLQGYLSAEMKPSFEALGFTCCIYEVGNLFFLLAERMENPSRPTVLGYGHGFLWCLPARLSVSWPVSIGIWERRTHPAGVSQEMRSR
jgi:hypothetical protein